MGNKQGSHAFVETERSGDVVANPVADCTDVPLHREPNRDGVFKASDLPGHTATARSMSHVGQRPKVPRAVKVSQESGERQARRVFITKGDAGFGFTFSTNTKAYLRGINHFISSTDPGGEAELSGLQVGDRILQIDNINTINMPHATVIKVLQHLPSNRPIRLLVSAPNALIKESLSLGQRDVHKPAAQSVPGSTPGSTEFRPTRGQKGLATAVEQEPLDRRPSKPETISPSTKRQGPGGEKTLAAVMTAETGPLCSLGLQYLAASVAQAAAAVLLVSGRQGLFSYVNGTYDFHCMDARNFPVYRHREVLSEEYGEAAGQPIYLYYHHNNRSWAIGQAIGSAEVVTFSSMSCPSPVDIFTPWTFESDETRDGYQEDSNVVIAVEKGENGPVGLDVYPQTAIQRSAIQAKRWKTTDSAYMPKSYTAPEIQAMRTDADKDLLAETEAGAGYAPAFNARDGGVNRISHDGRYEVVRSLPLNPLGRSGIAGRGCLRRWGPNHVVTPVITRWQLDDSGERIERDGQCALEVLTIRSSNVHLLPETTLLEGETHKEALHRRFFTWFGQSNTAALLLTHGSDLTQQMEAIFTRGLELFKGILDDPRNTDNAWLEAYVMLLHDDGQAFSAFPLPEELAWVPCELGLVMPAKHKAFLEQAVQMTGASFTTSSYRRNTVSVHL